jgi:tRNA pseudouridine38-40 synthase
MNAQLPVEIRVTRVEEMPSDFHARFSARSKTYRYLLSTAAICSPFERMYLWHVPEALDQEAMHHAAARLVGTHDFSAFQSTGSEPGTSVRTIWRSELVMWPHWFERDTPTLVAYEIEGDGFLRHMVRAIVGTLVAIGRGWRPPSSMTALLGGAARADAGATAPPQGLFLVRVDYD